MNLREWERAAGTYLKMNGVELFKPYELCEVGRVHQKTGTVLQAPPMDLLPNALRLIDVLLWLRSEEGTAPIDVNSWYRDPDYNAVIGGAPHSVHLELAAADVNKRGWSPKRVADTLERHHDAHLLGIGRYRTFTHVDVRGMIGREAPARWGSNV